MMEWISVEDRLPESSGNYLCSMGGLIEKLWYFKGLQRFKMIGGAENKYMEQMYSSAVTHWMPLPNPPE